MIIDLGSLRYTTAVGIINWCYEHNIDKSKCLELALALQQVPTPPVSWTIDVPEKHLTLFLLKWPI